MNMVPMPRPRIDSEAKQFQRPFELPAPRFGAEHFTPDVPVVNPEVLARGQNTAERQENYSFNVNQRQGSLALAASGVQYPLPRLETL